MIELQPENILSSVRGYLEQVKSEVLRLHEEARDPVQAIAYRTEAIDRLLVSLYQLAVGMHERNGGTKELRSALLSQGGYGRKELCLHSDIDLLFLYEGKADAFVKLLTETVLRTLWDAGLEVGFATRTIPDCKRMMERDLTIMTSLVDVRFIAGDRSLEEKFDQMISRYFSSDKNREMFFQLKMKENEERDGKYGGSVYLLEPNLKEGEGGLRDYHSLYWLARIRDGIEGPHDLATRRYVTEEEFKELWNALTFLWMVRNELHRRTGRRVDQLTFEHQEPIAHWMGFLNTPEILGVELFMQKYYAQASTLHTLTEKAIRRIRRPEPALFPPAQILPQDTNCRLVDGKLTIADPELFERDPLYLLKIFEIGRQQGAPFDDLIKERIEKNLWRIDDAIRSDGRSGEIFRGMLKQSIGLGTMFGSMNELGVLGAFLPEFKKLKFRVQHDLYHVYTVDIHSIFAVGELGKLHQGEYASSHPTLHQIVRDIERQDLLAFGILYHDIGKGEGKGHVEKGAPIIRDSAGRLGFSSGDQDVLEFLERSHLIMTHVAFRRDLEDRNMIIQFARAMQSLELLNMLYVLTFCDVKAVSPEAMTDWKASLIEYLYLKTREVIQKGAYTKEKAASLIPKVREEVLSLLSRKEDLERCREFFGMMSPRYLLATHPPLIVRHVRLWERFAADPIVFEARSLEKEGLNEVTLFTWEDPALFSRMAGLFAAHNINILEASLNLSAKGHALHLFKVTDHEGRMITDTERWERVEKDLRDVCQGRVPIENLVAEKFRPSLFKKKVAQLRPTRIDIDNDISAFYTVIDLYTQDRVGLLYQITSTLSALGLYIDVSKISTKVDQVADTFYVKDIFGHKITSEERLKKIKEILQKVVEEEPGPGWRPRVL